MNKIRLWLINRRKLNIFDIYNEIVNPNMFTILIFGLLIIRQISFYCTPNEDTRVLLGNIFYWYQLIFSTIIKCGNKFFFQTCQKGWINHILRKLFNVCNEGHELTTFLQVVFKNWYFLLELIRWLITDIKAGSSIFFVVSNDSKNVI